MRKLVVAAARAGGDHLSGPMVQRFRQTDPEIKAHRFGEVFLPVLAEGFCGKAADEFLSKEAVHARGIAMFFAAVPKGRLRFDGANYGIMVVKRCLLVDECRETGSMGDHLANSHVLFAALPKFRPKVRYPR